MFYCMHVQQCLQDDHLGHGVHSIAWNNPLATWSEQSLRCAHRQCHPQGSVCGTRLHRKQRADPDFKSSVGIRCRQPTCASSEYDQHLGSGLRCNSEAVSPGDWPEQAERLPSRVVPCMGLDEQQLLEIVDRLVARQIRLAYRT